MRAGRRIRLESLPPMKFSGAAGVKFAVASAARRIVRLGIRSFQHRKDFAVRLQRRMMRLPRGR
jgi:hypothetical protein